MNSRLHSTSLEKNGCSRVVCTGTPSPHTAAGLCNGSRDGQLQGEWRGGWGERVHVGETSPGARHPVFLSEQSSVSPHPPGVGRASRHSSPELEWTFSNQHRRVARRPSRQAFVESEQTSSIQRYRGVGHLSGAPTSGPDGVSGVHGHWVQAHPLPSSAMDRLHIPKSPSSLG